MEKIIQNGEPLVIENQTIDTALDFTNILQQTLVSDGIYEVQVKGPITFKNCTFTKPVIAYKKTANGIVNTNFHANVSFLECVFEEEVNMRGMTVYGKTNFSKSIFHKKAVFEESSLFQKAYFLNCRFDEELRFQNTVFFQFANFLRTEFNKVSSFQSVQFRDDAQMGDTEFYGYADFSLTEFSGNALFNYAKFTDRAIFSNAIAYKRFEMMGSQHKDTQITGYRFMGETKWDEAPPKGVTFKDNLHLFNKNVD